MTKEKYHLTVAQFPGGGTSRWETMEWVTRMCAGWRDDVRLEHVSCAFYNDTPITMTRNRAVKDALAHGSDYLLMIDSDIVPDIDEEGSRPFWETAWDFMLRRRARETGQSLPPATIGAPYCGPPPIENIFVFHWGNWESDDPDHKIAIQQYTREHAASLTGIGEVAALPTGLILYDLRLFRQLPKPWFDYEWADEERSEKASTEDVYQTRNASLLGFPQYCAWDCWAGHMKTKRVGKPHPITVEDVNGLLRDAIRSDLSRRRKITFVDEDRPEVSGALAGRANGDI
jgi:hypothetical protein